MVAEFCDDGHSGARLDRPGLDALRDAAEAGLIERVWCLSPDRLARVYAYQVIVLDELARHGVSVRFTDAPPLDDDPQARLLTQVQGVIAEYERAKIAERYRRGKLFRSRAGEVLAWRIPYGYRRQPRDAHGPARLVVFEPEAAMVRRIFDDAAARRALPTRDHPPAGRRPDTAPDRPRPAVETLHAEQPTAQRGLHRADLRQPHRSRPRPPPRQAQPPGPPPARGLDRHRGARHHRRADLRGRPPRSAATTSQWSPRRAEPGQWLLRGLVKCGVCRVGVNCHKRRGRDGAWNRYYHCRNHDPIKAGGDDRRCPERNIRSDALDDFRLRPGPRRPVAPRRAHRRRTGPRRAHP